MKHLFQCIWELMRYYFRKSYPDLENLASNPRDYHTLKRVNYIFWRENGKCFGSVFPPTSDEGGWQISGEVIWFLEGKCIFSRPWHDYITIRNDVQRKHLIAMLSL